MYASAALWRAGACHWRVKHDAQEGIYHLEAEGQLPPDYEGIRRDCLAEQDAEGGDEAEVDIVFEVPLRLARSLCGFKHDEPMPAGESVSFEELKPSAANKGWRSFLKR